MALKLIGYFFYRLAIRPIDQMALCRQQGHQIPEGLFEFLQRGINVSVIELDTGQNHG